MTKDTTHPHRERAYPKKACSITSRYPKDWTLFPEQHSTLAGNIWKIKPILAHSYRITHEPIPHQRLLHDGAIAFRGATDTIICIARERLTRSLALRPYATTIAMLRLRRHCSSTMSTSGVKLLLFMVSLFHHHTTSLSSPRTIVVEAALCSTRDSALEAISATPSLDTNLAFACI